MKVIGIICEYNPFHNGHLYHLSKIKEKYPDSLIVLVLNGYFLQRGEISIISKQDKVNLALIQGIDIILELPFVYGTQSADIFANASISMLEELKCDYVIFGSECNDIDKLNEITDYTLKSKDKYDNEVKKYLNEGLNYPTALAKAINIDFEFNSNDLLGISYLKSIKINNYQIQAETIKRTNNYLDIDEDNEIISASNIRNKILNKIDISKYVPESTLSFLKNVTLNDFFEKIKYKIITEHDLSIYLDVDEGIENRLKNIINECSNIDELIEKVKTRRYTYNKIRRMLIHILIGFTKQDNQNLTFDYLKILGFNSEGKKYLNKVKKDINIPIIPNKYSLTYQYEIKAALLYDMVTNERNIDFEISNKPIKF